MLKVGSEGLYEWVSDQQFDPLQLCPEIALWKYIAITSFDSGPLVLTNEEIAAGWESRGNIAYSPKIQDIASLPVPSMTSGTFSAVPLTLVPVTSNRMYLKCHRSRDT